MRDNKLPLNPALSVRVLVMVLWRKLATSNISYLVTTSSAAVHT